MNVGLESIAFHTPHTYLDLASLARERGVDPNKYLTGLGQERMSVPAPDEDVVTLAANAAARAVSRTGIDGIDTLMFATESGIDQSKAAGIYVHRLLGLAKNCKTFEIKQACCGSTAGLQMALSHVARYPDKRVLLVASDIARYELGSPGEPTQGAGAVAMVVSARPRLLAVEPETGSYTEDVMDFWRPNYREEALVDGKYSCKIYMKAMTESWDEYGRESGRSFADHHRFCYHLPFTRMAEKAHAQLARHTGAAGADRDEQQRQIEDGLRYNRLTGNSYTASLYIGLCSLLDHAEDDLGGQRLGLFSYGSGCMAAYFSGIVLPGYRDHLHADAHREMMGCRTEIDVETYERFYGHRLPQDGGTYRTPRNRTGSFRLAGIKDHKRLYETCSAAAARPKAAVLPAPRRAAHRLTSVA